MNQHKTHMFKYLPTTEFYSIDRTFAAFAFSFSETWLPDNASKVFLKCYEKCFVRRAKKSKIADTF